MVTPRVIEISASQGHIVPTAIAFDGANFFIGNLGIFPIVDGSQYILKVSPTGQVTTFATGFTTIVGLAFDSHGKLYVLENTTGNPFPRGRSIGSQAEGKAGVSPLFTWLARELVPLGFSLFTD